MTGVGKATDAKESLADLGLVGLVAGGAVSLLLGILTLGIGALLGRIPLFLAGLLGLSILVTMTGLVVTIVTGRNRERGTRLPAPPEESG